MQLAHLRAATVAGAFLCAGAAQAVTELNASTWFPEGHPYVKQGYRQLAERVAKASNGDLKINVFAGGSLLPANAHLSGLRDGVADITYHAGTYTPSDLPEDNVLSMLSITMKDDAMAVTFAVTDFYANDPEMKALWNKQKIVFLGGYSTAGYNLLCNKPVEKLADLKGLKLRSPGPVQSDWMRTVGATPVNVPSTEMFTGLDKGQLDCAVIVASELKARSIWDVAKFANMANLGPFYSGWMHAMNGATWRKLTPAHRRIVLDAIPDALVDLHIAHLATVTDSLAEAAAHRVKVIQPSADINKSITDFARTARATAIKEGKERFKLKDPEGLISRFEATQAKWEKLLAGVDRKDAAALKKLLHTQVFEKLDAAKYGL